MSDALQQFLVTAEATRKKLRAIKGAQVQSKPMRDDIRHFAETYFSEIRPAILQGGVQALALKETDDTLQNLAQACHKRGRVATYLTLVDRARKALIELDGLLLSTGATSSSPSITAVDQEIIRTLAQLVPGASFSYQQALQDLQDPSRLSWRGPATDLREALRETLDHLAPDADVTAMPGFKLEQNTSGPTMKQKVRYVLKNRDVSKSVSDPAEDAATIVDTIIGTFVRSVYMRSSVSTHTPTDRKEVTRLLQYVRLVLSELLEIEA